MTPPSPDDNPFAPPDASIGDRATALAIETDADAELTRRFHLAHEASIKSLGLLGYLAAALGLLITTGTLVAARGPLPPGSVPPGSSEPIMRAMMWVGAGFYGVLSLVSLAMGIGLRRLQVWSRWTGLVLMVLSTLYSLAVGGFLLMFMAGPNATPIALGLAFSLAIQGYILYLLIAPKSNMVFSSEYHLVIR